MMNNRDNQKEGNSTGRVSKAAKNPKADSKCRTGNLSRYEVSREEVAQHLSHGPDLPSALSEYLPKSGID